MSIDPPTDRSKMHASSETFQGDLSVTSLYTAGVWHWAQIEGASLIADTDTDRVFKFTNAALSVMRFFRWNLPKLPEGLAQRHYLIDQLALEADVDLIIEFASGLSMRGWRTMTKPSNKAPKRYIELDLPHVIAHKRLKLSALPTPSTLSFVAADIKTLDESSVSELFHGASSTVLIAEGLVMYLSHDEFEVFLGLLAPELKAREGKFIFDWVPTIEQAPPGFIGRMLGMLMRTFTGGESFQRDTRSRQFMRELLMKYGAKQVEVMDTHKVAVQCGLPFPDANTQQVIFCAKF